MKFIMVCLMLSLALFQAQAQDLAISKESFDHVNLLHPGLEKTRSLYLSARYGDAAAELLSYYRNRTNVKLPGFNLDDAARFKGKPIGAANEEKAGKALLHQFQPHKGYGYFPYGDDIDWTFWPVKDNEVRWQLHRLGWWPVMGAAYRSSGDEKYAKEWVFQFRDWTRKNQLGLSPENDRYAWRPLEASERIQIFPAVFNLFVASPNFTPAFLLEFLGSTSMQAEYVRNHYSESGNHMLFEAQRVLGIGSFFPELKSAAAWRRSGIEVLNREIKKQVYDDGMQWELSPVYHVATIEIFVKAYQSANMAGMADEFPKSYVQTIAKMIEATADISFPDYSTPMFGDSWQTKKEDRIKQFQEWAKLFADIPSIKYFASAGKEGTPPAHLSHQLRDAGFYTFRNGWDGQSTVMLLKASPPGEFHAQPDNGTFELWVKGRNFTPDSGCYVYSGDAAVTRMRDWYRQSRVHSTLTLNNQNMVITQAVRHKWETGANLDVLSYTNPSYGNLKHQRSVLFINKKFFLIIDKAIGSATGNVGVHFQLKEDSNPVFSAQMNKIHTSYPDGNNLLIQSLDRDGTQASQEAGKVSYVYKQETARPAFVFEQDKKDAATRKFTTVVYPYDGKQPPEISVKENAGNINGNVDLSITVNGETYDVKAKLD
jgi:heparan-sulfate lyase